MQYDLIFHLTERSSRAQKTFLALVTAMSNMLTYNGNGLREENDTTISVMVLSMTTQLMVSHNQAKEVQQEASAAQAIKAHVKLILISCAR